MPVPRVLRFVSLPADLLEFTVAVAKEVLSGGHDGPVSWCQPNTALMCGAMESMHHSCYKEYSGHLIGLRENINTTDLRRTNQVTVVRIG